MSGRRSENPKQLHAPPRSVARSTKPIFALGIACIALLFMAVVLVFAQTVRFGFIDYDDDEYVYNNPAVRSGLTWPGIVAAFGGRHSNNWHPLTWISHMVDCQLYGPWAGGHHLSSMLIHATTAIALFWLLLRMTGRPWPTRTCRGNLCGSSAPRGIGGVDRRAQRCTQRVFVHVDAVVLCGLCHAGILSRPIHGHTRRFQSWSDGEADVGKRAVGAFAPGLLAAGAMAGSRAEEGQKRCFSQAVAVGEDSISAALSAISCGLTLWAQQDTMHRTGPIAFLWRAANAVVGYVTYLGRFVWPANLVVLYPHPVAHQQFWRVAVCGFLLVAITVAVLHFRKDYPSLLVGWLLYLVTLVPVIGLVQVGRRPRPTAIPICL